MYTSACFVIYLLAVAALFGFRQRLGVFWSAFGFTILTLLYLRFGFSPLIPRSFQIMGGTITIISVLLYVTSSQAGREAFWLPIRNLMVERRQRPVLYALLAIIPGVVAWQSYAASLPSEEPPPLLRSVHPSPPGAIAISPHGAKEGKTVDLILGRNPYRELETSKPEEFKKRVSHGKSVYYQNCFFCHGDKLVADGHLAGALSPPPAKFTDEVLPMFQETFFFWRIAKGGPGLPDEGTPWDTAMPVWEKMLSEEDMWSVILYLYDRQGLRPRKQEAKAGK
ncbi:MAG TPA: cytochrome c [Polyangiaceae bacterium]|jgi:mono/diheme cytochrome c family protein